MTQGIGKLRWLPALAAVALGFLGAAQPARSECLSPSAATGATATTVYRCPEGNEPASRQLIVIDPGKTTEVERGSAELPWFEPKPTKTADPIQTVKSPPKKVEDSAKVAPAPPDTTKASPAPAEAAKVAPAPPDATKASPAPAEAAKVAPAPPDTTKASPAPAEAAKVDPAPEEITKAKAAKPKKIVKAKRTKVKAAKAKPGKVKVAKTEPGKVKPTKAEPTKFKFGKAKRTKTQTAKTETAKETTTAEPAKSDGKVILWTKKDMPLGTRIGNWLGF